MTASRSRPVFLVAAVVAVTAALAPGYLLGHNQQKGSPEGFSIHTGTVLESPYQGTAWAHGFAYSLRPDVDWVDSQGTIHQSQGRPPCIPLHRWSRAVFATVTYPIPGGATVGSVVWVRC